MGVKSLPPLPGSDPQSLADYRPDSFYKKKARDVWYGGQVDHTEIQDRKCSHDWHSKEEVVECKKCHIGYIGKGLKVRNGKLEVDPKFKI